MADLPERVGVVDRHGKVVDGTVDRNQIAPPAQGEMPAVEVVNDQGTVIGHMVPGIGYVTIEERSSPGYDEEKLRDEIPTTTIHGRAAP